MRFINTGGSPLPVMRILAQPGSRREDNKNSREDIDHSGMQGAEALCPSCESWRSQVRVGKKLRQGAEALCPSCESWRSQVRVGKATKTQGCKGRKPFARHANPGAARFA
jgi:hypothetical protein